MNSRVYPGFKNLPPKQLIFNISAIIILCSLGVIIYSNTFHIPFQFDDNILIRNLSVISNPSDIGTIWRFWASRFITFFTFALNYHFNGLHVFGYHLVNLIIHLGSGLTAFWLISLLLSTPEMKEDKIAKHANLMAFLGALIFLSHPVQTESVTFIFQRTTCLAGFFYILSLCLYLKSRLLNEEGKPASKGASLYIFSWVFVLAAMFTKENTITLPLMIILCELCFFKTGRHIKWRYALPFLIILPLIPILLFSTKSIISGDVERLAVPSAYSDPHSFLTHFRAMITYIRLSFIPINQNLDYYYPIVSSPFDLPALASLFALIVIVVAAFKLFKRYRLISFSIFWFFLTILPESSLIHLKKGEGMIYEHWLYLPLFGYGLFLVSVAYYLFGKSFLKTMVSTLLVIAACYSILAYNRNLVWKDEFTLWNDAVLKSPQKARPYNNRGLAYFHKGNLDQAISDYNKAIEINPNLYEAYNNRGNVYRKQGNLDQAISDYSKAIEINPNLYEPYNNRGVAYQNKGNLDQAISDYNKAITINPEYGKAYYNRGLAYFNKKDYDKAWENVHKAEGLGYKVNPQFIVELKKASGREK